MGKIITVLMIAILAIGLVGCDEIDATKTKEVASLLEEVKEETNLSLDETAEKQEQEQEEKEEEQEEIITETETETETASFDSNTTINGKQFKLQKDSIEMDNIINLFSLSAQEFLDTFEIDTSYLGGPVEQAGTIGGSTYIAIDEVIFYHEFYFSENEDFENLTLIKITDQRKSEAELHLKLANGDKVVRGMTADEVRAILGAETELRDVFWGDEVLGDELVYIVENYTGDYFRNFGSYTKIELFLFLDKDTKEVENIGIRLN